MRVVKILVPPDKSISHRAIMLASISKGTTRIENLLMGDDCLRTIGAFRAMGVRILFSTRPSASLEQYSSSEVPSLSRDEVEKDIGRTNVVVHGVGMRGLKKPNRPIYLGNSGTTMRILPGILAGQNFQVVLKGDSSLSKRPMRRIIEPLRRMGAEISGLRNTEYGIRNTELHPPLKIKGGRLKAIRYKSKIASAQLKSCILLAGLFADGITRVAEPVKSRDHTERMLRQFGVRCKVKGLECEVKGPAGLRSPHTLEIPGDISSAAFFIVAGCILPGTKIVLKNVGLNPTRTGILDVLEKMGARLRITNHESRTTNREPAGDIVVKSSRLKGVTISPKEVVRAIDEIPIIMVAACLAKGTTIIRGISELRVKETDRIKSMVTNLQKMGADIEVISKVGTRTRNLVSRAKPTVSLGAVVINGGKPLHGARVSSYGDHRTAMSMLIAGMAAKDKVTVTGLDCISKSFPGFTNLLRNLN